MLLWRALLSCLVLILLFLEAGLSTFKINQFYFSVPRITPTSTPTGLSFVVLMPHHIPSNVPFHSIDRALSELFQPPEISSINPCNCPSSADDTHPCTDIYKTVK